MIFHIALAADWVAAKESGDYRISTRGRTLADEGFIHCSHAAQLPGVFNAFYADAPGPLVLLRIDPALLGVEVREEEPAPGAGLFPHVYGPIPVAAVVDARPYP